MDEPRQEPHGAGNGEQSAETGSQLPLWAPETPLSSPLSAPAVGPTSAQDPPWSLADLGTFVLFAAVSFVFANLLLASALLLLRERFAWEIALEEAFTETPFVVFLQAGWELLWLLFIYLIITVKYRRRFWQALKWVRGPHHSVAYLMGGVALALVAQLLFNVFPSEKHLPIERLFSSVESAYLLAFFGICVAPFVEELVFRGFFYPVFERLWGLLAAVVCTALLFACIHIPQLSGGWQEIAVIFVVGAVFSYCRGKTRSLLPPFLMHLAYNASLFVSLYLSTDRFRDLSG